jgi:hypothetical protein
MTINTTFFASTAHEKPLLQWLREQYIPRMLATGDFTVHKLYKVLSAAEADSVNYSLQFDFAAIAVREKWESCYVCELENEVRRLFGENVLTLSTLLKKM